MTIDTLPPQNDQVFPQEVPLQDSTLQLPLGHTLHEQLLLLSGHQPGEWRQDPVQISQDEANNMTSYLLERIPSILEAHSLPSNVTTYEEKYNNGYGYFVTHKSQVWGAKPTEEQIHAVGKLVEFAGPTYGTNDPRAIYDVNPDVVTNIDGRMGDVDMYADVRNMPFQDESIGGVFISCLPGAMGRLHKELEGWQTLRAEAIDEATRVLKSGGYFYWLGGTPDDVDKILDNGFEPVQLTGEVWTSKEIPPTVAGKLLGLIINEPTYSPVEYSIDGVYQKVTQ